MTAIVTTDEKITWVRVMCDYSADPLWGRDGAMIELGELEMSPRLNKRLQEWAERFEELSAKADAEPEASLDQEWTAFAMQGRHIAATLKDDRPELTVVYFDQSRFTGVKDQDRAEFEYEMTTKMADRLFSETDWPDGDYMCMSCAYCRSPFQGPKRQRHCVACDEVFVVPAYVEASKKALSDRGLRPLSTPPDDGRLVLVLTSEKLGERYPSLSDIAGRVVAATWAFESEADHLWEIPADNVVMRVTSDDLIGWSELYEGIRA